jgi:hypothetical protein
MVNRVHSLNFLMLVTLLFSMVQSTSLFAVDEEYFIPYTDNYGYEYDPQTGTYIKTDPPQSASEQSAPQQVTNSSDTSNNNINASNPGNRTEPIANSNVSDEDSNISIQLPLFIAGLLGMLAISIFLAKKLKKS